MIFRYWLEDGHTTVIKNVDRVVFDSLNKLSVRYMLDNHTKFKSLVHCVDYIQFTVTTE